MSHHRILLPTDIRVYELAKLEREADLALTGDCDSLAEYCRRIVRTFSAENIAWQYRERILKPRRQSERARSGSRERKDAKVYRI